MTEQKYIKWLSATVLFLVSLVTVISFILSYEALWRFALDGGKPWYLSWLWPVIIDLPIIVFSVVALFAVVLGHKPWPFQALVLLATAATVWFNYSYAVHKGLSWEVYITAPIMYFVSFEVLVWLIKIVSGRSVIITKIAEISAKLAVLEIEYRGRKDNLEAELKRLEYDRLAEIGQLESQRATLQTEVDKASQKLSDISQQVEEKRRELNTTQDATLVNIWDLISHVDKAHLDTQTRQFFVALLTNAKVSQKDISEWAGVTVKTVQRDIQGCNGLIKKAG